MPTIITSPGFDPINKRNRIPFLKVNWARSSVGEATNNSAMLPLNQQYQEPKAKSRDDCESARFRLHPFQLSEKPGRQQQRQLRVLDRRWLETQYPTIQLLPRGKHYRQFNIDQVQSAQWRWPSQLITSGMTFKPSLQKPQGTPPMHSLWQRRPQNLICNLGWNTIAPNRLKIKSYSGRSGSDVKPKSMWRTGTWFCAYHPWSPCMKYTGTCSESKH